MALTRITTYPAVAGEPSAIFYAGDVWFVVHQNGAVFTVYWTTDLVTWTDTADSGVSGSTGNINYVKHAGGYWFLKRSGVTLVKSADLATWTTVANIPSGFDVSSTDIASDGTTYVLVANKYAAGPGGPYHSQFAKTTDLSTWSTDIILSSGLNWPYGAANRVAYYDRRWFISAYDAVTLSPTTRFSVSVSLDLATWSFGVEIDSTTPSEAVNLTKARTGVVVYRDAEAADVARIRQWNAETHSFDILPTEVDLPLLWDGIRVGHGGAPVFIIDDDSGWSTFTDIGQYSLADGWVSPAIGAPTAPVVLADDVIFWDTGNDGTLFYSEIAGTEYLDFYYSETTLNTGADEGYVFDGDAVSDGSATAFAVAATVEDDADADEVLELSATVNPVEVEDATIEADEVLTDEWMLLVQEAGTADDLLTPSAAAALTLEDDGEATDALTLYFTATLTDEFLPATEELTPEYALWQTETATADELMTPTTVFSVTLEDEATADDAAYLVHGQDVNDETITAYESLLPTVALLLVDQTITADEDLIEAGAPSIDTMVETATADDLLTVTVASLDEIIEVATATDTLLAKDATAVAWVLNPDTTAAYWYSNFQFTDAVQVGDKLLAVGPDGLCVLTGNTDAGENIDAAIQTGMMDFGSEQKKRVREFRFGLTGGPMTVTVEVQGQGTSYTYAMPAAVTGLPRNARIVPGQGLNSRYWRLTIENEGGAHFDNRSTVAEIAVHTRRL